MKKRASEDFVVLTKTYDLLLWYVQQIGRFRRQHWYSLGVRIEKHLFRVMEWLTIARYQRDNRRHLEKVNLRLEVVAKVRLSRSFALPRCAPSEGRGITCETCRARGPLRRVFGLCRANVCDSGPKGRFLVAQGAALGLAHPQKIGFKA